MFHHFIILHSDYSEGKRIAYHKCSKSIKDIDGVFLLMNELKKTHPHLSFGFHHILTEQESWASIKEYDMFFKDIFPVNSQETFIKLISEDDKISALDIANLIISKISCTHLKLQKLLYFFYCNHIKNKGYPPFPEKFLAWDYGPVIREVYDTYKVYGRNNIKYSEDDVTTIVKEEPFKLSVYSRFKKTPTYGDVLESLDETLIEYGNHSANRLVDITHQDRTPWDKTFQEGKGRNNEISVDLIKEYIDKTPV